MTGFLRGSATALITPFSQEGVDFSALGELIDHQIENGTDALVILGTTGEPAAMTEEEKTAVMRFAAGHAGGKIKLIFGAGCNDTRTTVSMCKRAEALGADGVLVVTPYYNKCTQEGLYLHYRAAAESVGIPVIAYNVPSRTGVNLLPETAARLAEIENIAGIKEASGNMAQTMETLRLVRGKCDVYSGDDALNLPVLAAGGSAVISVVSNLAPKRVKALCEAALAGRREEAIALSESLLPLAKACFTEVNPIPVKAGANMIGFRAGLPRLPLTPLGEEHRRQLRDALIGLGLKVRA